MAANRLYDEINKYLSTLNPSTQKAIFIVGHSRGAAIANILGAKFEDVQKYDTYSYTFATPNTVDPEVGQDPTSYKTIYNIVNKDDLVPCLPLKSWGFTKYGKTYEISIEEKYEDTWGEAQFGTWEYLFGVDYNYNGAKESTISAMDKVANDRADLYKQPISKDAIYVYQTKYYSLSEAQTALDNQNLKYGDRIARHCTLFIAPLKDLFGKTFYRVESCQNPAFLMVVLPDMIAKKCHSSMEYQNDIVPYVMRGTDEDKYFGVSIGFFVSQKYAKAKELFVKSGSDSNSVMMFLRRGGMVHEHIPGTYYFISNDYKMLLSHQ